MRRLEQITDAVRVLQADMDSRLEELVSWLTHGVGLLAAVGGFAFLLLLALEAGRPLMTVAVTVYGVSLVTLYAASTFYHLARTPWLRRAMKVFDHAAIFGLIAGSWTPFLLGPLRESGLAWWLLGIVWGLAVLGIGLKLFFTGRFRLLSTGVYLGMGWLGLAVIAPLHALVDAWVMFWLVAGGLAYTGGIVFYLWRTLPFSHGIWHLFVLAGSACHFVAIMALVGP